MRHCKTVKLVIRPIASDPPWLDTLLNRLIYSFGNEPLAGYREFGLTRYALLGMSHTYGASYQRRNTMFGKPISKLTDSDIRSFCDRKIPEGLIIDYKIDFPSDLAKILASFANSFGGYVLIGIATNPDNTPKSVEGVANKAGIKERIMQAATTGIHQPLFPDIALCELPGASKVVVIIYIAPSLDAPHVVTGSSRIPYRVADITDPVRDADIDRIEYLLKRREAPERDRSLIVERADERFHYRAGRQATRKLIAGPLFPHAPLCSLEQTMDILKRASTSMMRGDLVAIPGGSCKSRDTSYAELNQKGMVLFYETLHPDKECHGAQTIDYPISLRALAQFIKFMLTCYEDLSFDALVRIDFTLENVRGYKLWHTEPEATIADTSIVATHLCTASAIAADPYSCLAPLVCELVWNCGLETLDEKTAVRHLREEWNEPR